MKKLTKRKFKKLLEMSNIEARDFFLKNESYCNFELPKYFKFDPLINLISNKITDKKLSNFYNNNKKNNNPRKYDNVNHTLLHNKDGRFAWRHFELINPVLYVALVHAITDSQNWGVLVDRFKLFQKNKKIECMSLPVEAIGSASDKATQINKWWHDVEQKSIEMSLEYEYIFKTDITDCYPSIYTHSIAWALHDKNTAKKDRDNKGLLGNVIDNFLCDMSNGQTNGIPQGSSLTDLISEIVLGYADMLLTEKIENEIIHYHIIRYRDDYRIFVHNTSDGHLIVKYLCEVLIDLGLKLNPAKTVISKNIVKHSVKEDKRFWSSQKIYDKNPLKYLLTIHDLASKYSNSGSLITALNEYSRIIKKRKKINNAKVLISIIVDIAYNNPKVYPVAAAILSNLISYLKDKNEKLDIFKKIEIKFKKIPNTEHLQLWLQRITLFIDREYSYNAPLCQLVVGKDVEIWNFEWLNVSFKDSISVKSIVDNQMIESLSEIIEPEEVALFKSYN